MTYTFLNVWQRCEHQFQIRVTPDSIADQLGRHSKPMIDANWKWVCQQNHDS